MRHTKSEMTKKNQFSTLQKYFSDKTYYDCDRSCDVISCETSRFLKY